MWKWEQADTFPRPKLWEKIKEVLGINPRDYLPEEKAFETLSENECPEFMCLPKYRSRLTGEGGELRKEDRIETMLAFRTEWISKIGDFDDLALFHVAGNSMEPAINDGDVVMVNKAVDLDDIVPGAIYAFAEKHHVQVKRIIIQGEKLIAMSDNKETFPPYEIDMENFSLLGRVVWSGHEHK